MASHLRLVAISTTLFQRNSAVRYLSTWVRRLMVCMACMAFAVTPGCDQPNSDKFAGFASEQLSEQIEIVSAKLDESIENNEQSQSTILAAVRDLSQAVAGMQLVSQSQMEELKKVSGKAKSKLISTGETKDGVATLDPNAAPSAKLQLDSLDDAAAQIEELTKRIDELDKRCQCGKLNAAAAAPASNYPAVTSGKGGNSSGTLRSSFSGNSSGSYQGSVYQVGYEVAQPVVTYSQPVYSAPVQPTYQSTVSNQCYIDPVTGVQVCNENVSQSQTQSYRRGLFGRRIPN